MSKWSGLIMWDHVQLSGRFTRLTLISHFSPLFLHTWIKWQLNFFTDLAVQLTFILPDILF